MGCTSNDMLAMEEFNSFVIASGQDCGYSGNKFSWAGKEHGLHKKFAWLDRVFTRLFWQSSFPAIEVQHLARKISDHVPLLVRSKGTYESHGPLPFHLKRRGC